MPGTGSVKIHPIGQSLKMLKAIILVSNGSLNVYALKFGHLVVEILLPIGIGHLTRKIPREL